MAAALDGCVPATPEPRPGANVEEAGKGGGEEASLMSNPRVQYHADYTFSFLRLLQQVSVSAAGVKPAGKEVEDFVWSDPRPV